MVLLFLDCADPSPTHPAPVPNTVTCFRRWYEISHDAISQIWGMSLWTGQELRQVSEEDALKAEKQYDGQRSEAELHFSSLKRVLAQELPAFKLDPTPAHQI